METLTLVAVVLVALFFDFTNGFHDTANSIATSVSTRALSPRLAVLLAAVLNFLGAFVSIKVAATVAKGIVDPSAITLNVVLAGLVGAITWNLITWYLGLPSSSSHALIGGLIGAAIAAVGSGAISVHGIIQKVVAPGILAIFVCGFAAFLATSAAYLLIRTLGQAGVASDTGFVAWKQPVERPNGGQRCSVACCGVGAGVASSRSYIAAPRDVCHDMSAGEAESTGAPRPA